MEKYLGDQRKIVESELERLLPPENSGDPLVSAMRHSVLTPGKRIRPILVLAIAELLGTPTRAVLPTACAIELLHTYTLIHDDLPSMDNDEFRRGVPTAHKNFGEATAILAGDALQALAFEVMVRGTPRELVSPENILSVVSEIAEGVGVFGVVGGQQLDLWFGERPLAAEKLREIHQKKTAALFRAAVRSAAILCGASAVDLARLTRFSEYLGIAFQIRDDIKDYGATGKKQGTSLPKLVGVEKSQEALRHELELAEQALQGLGGNAPVLATLVDMVRDT